MTVFAQEYLTAELGENTVELMEDIKKLGESASSQTVASSVG